MVRVAPWTRARNSRSANISWRLTFRDIGPHQQAGGDYSLGAVYDDESTVRVVIAETGIQS